MKIAYGFTALVLLLLGVAGASAAGQRDGASIRNSGSTNTSAYSIQLWSDGTAASGSLHGHVAQSIVSKFFADARAMKALGAKNARTGCMKSASFGSATFVTYHGWTSGDLECAAGGTLASDAHAVAAALHLPQVGRRRIPMLPNEPRRPEAPSQASPTPESSPSAP